MRLLTTNYCTESSTTLSASNIDTNFPVSNLKNIHRSKRVRTNVGTTTLAVVFDMQTSESINTAVLLWPKEDGIRLTDSATVRIQANATNVWTSPSVNQLLTINNDYSVASHFFSSDETYRYWRVVIEDSTNPWDFIELGMVWLGKSLEIENAQNGFKFSVIDQTNVISNEFGHKYMDEYPQKTRLEIAYSYLENDDIEVLENAYRTNGNRKPVLIALDPDEAVFDKDHFLLYGTMGGEFALTHVKYDLLNVNGISIEELS
jgi:hypothetical protein